MLLKLEFSSKTYKFEHIYSFFFEMYTISGHPKIVTKNLPKELMILLQNFVIALNQRLQLLKFNQFVEILLYKSE
jgi:hypothetical protein